MKSDQLLHLFVKLQKNRLIAGVRGGFIMAIPLVLIGSFSLVGQTILDGIGITNPVLSLLYAVFSLGYQATFGLLSTYVAFFICLRCVQFGSVPEYVYGAPVAALAGLVILSGGFEQAASSGSLGVMGMFTAIVSALATAYLYPILAKHLPGRKLFSYGGDIRFQNILTSLLPTATLICAYALIDQLILLIFKVPCLQDLFVLLTDSIFENMGRGFGSMLLFTLLCSFLWFFGIHGNNVLENVSQHLFAPAIQENAALVAAGQVPTEIFSKTFFDSFLLMGGCGATAALLISIFLFSKNQANRGLAKATAIPVICNINELLLYGFPIVLNPVFMIPFFLTPVVCLISSYGAMSLGLVPLPTIAMSWPTPILISGYLCTGSIAGSVLQLFNLLLGILIYAPFVRLYDKIQQANTVARVRELTSLLQKVEKTGDPVSLTSGSTELSLAARHLAFELKDLLVQGKLPLYYQPQFNDKDQCIGVESLIRWNHPQFGMIYPPLVIQLARETDLLQELEQYIFLYVYNDCKSLREIMGDHAVVSLNLTPETLKLPSFYDFLTELSQRPDFIPRSLCIEITEQTELAMNTPMERLLKEIHSMGFLLAIDDFSMGSTSLKYLQHNQFDFLKLDGVLVRNLQKDPNAREIILSISSLSQALNIEILAEYTETRNLQKELAELGCNLYQGYLYSPAVPLEQLPEVLEPYMANKEL